ncbi:3221_t:CDS:2 [Diversispora eburnea]|uniref:3221_t:CDS:1 n=1 Tax=Diversispora eburnea TaxID=1213867 RepID=A0A9N9FZS6_9GLOM|nr:3221_t:CDS:2 [Diversispora eburnea]
MSLLQPQVQTILSPPDVKIRVEEESLFTSETCSFPIVLGERITVKNNIIPFDQFNVGLLKEFIWEKRVDVISSFKMDLWKVEIEETDENIEKLQNIETDIKEEFGGVKLLATSFASEIYSNSPPKKRIHIIVQLPATTGKRKPEDPDEENDGQGMKRAKTLASFLSFATLQSPDVKNLSHKFYDRDQTLNSILDVARTNYSGRKSSDHKDHQFILIPGGIGIGKTRMGWESQHMLSILKAKDSDTDDFVEALNDPCYIFVDLNNGCKYIKGFDEVAETSVRIGARVAVASGLVSESLSDLSKMNVNLFRLPDVICEILKRRFKTKLCSVEAIIIHLDEYQLYINDVQKDQQQSWADARDYFKALLREIGSVMRGNMMIRTESGHAGNSHHGFNGRYFIIPICTGTSAIDIHFLPTEHTNRILELKPLDYESAKSMFLDKYECSRQTTETGRNLVVQGLKLRYSSDLNNENIERLSTEFCNFVLNQQHFRIAIFDTGFIPKFIDDLLGPSVLTSDFDWGNQLFTKISKRTVAMVGNDPGNWKSLNDIRTVISFGLTGQLVKRDFLLPSRTSIGELERAGLVYLSNSEDEWYTIVMPFIMLKILNNKLLVSHVETVFPDHLLLIPTHDSPWQWQNFELLYVYYQKAIIDSLIEVRKSIILSIQHKIQLLQSCLQQEVEANKRLQIGDEIKIQRENLTCQLSMNWRLSDIFRGAKGVDALLQRRVQLRKLNVFAEKDKFLERTDSIANLNKSILCDDNVTRSFDEGIFRCYRGCANIDHRLVLDSSDSGKKLAIFSQIKYSECDASTTISIPFIKNWYETTIASVKNYKTEYDVVLVLFTNRRCLGHLNVGQMPQLLLIYLENIESYLSPTFAHRGLVDRPSEK